MNNIADFTNNSRNTLISTARKLNSTMDSVFYDVSSLTVKEKEGLSAHTNPEGTVVIVSPGSENEKINNQTPLEYITGQRKRGAKPIDVVVVAGVGSSALGTAALARNVADCMKCRVAGIVSGYGLADLFSEAMGGWYVLGYKNRIRDSLAKWFDALEMKDHVWDDSSYESLIKENKFTGFQMEKYVYGSPDAASLLLLLFHLRQDKGIDWA